MRFIIIILLFLFIYQANANSPCLWQVSQGEQKLYLFGSLHMLDQKPAFPDYIEKAYQSAETLVLEADVGTFDQAVILLYITQNAFYKNGQSLDRILSKKDWQKLEQTLAKMGLDSDLFKNYRPWFLAITLTTLSLQEQGYQAEHGIDINFQKQAKSDKKDIVYLEKAIEQIKLLASFNPKVEIEMLMQTLEENDSLNSLMQKIQQAWLQGDSEGLHYFVVEKMQQEYSDLYQELLVKRNYNWLEQLKHLLETKEGNIFVVVGAGHLLGEQGVPSLFAKENYEVTASCY